MKCQKLTTDTHMLYPGWFVKSGIETAKKIIEIDQDVRFFLFYFLMNLIKAFFKFSQESGIVAYGFSEFYGFVFFVKDKVW